MKPTEAQRPMITHKHRGYCKECGHLLREHTVEHGCWHEVQPRMIHPGNVSGVVLCPCKRGPVAKP